MISYMHLPPSMDHNEFDFIDDLVNPFKDFIRRLSDEHEPRKKEETEEVKKSDEAKL